VTPADIAAIRARLAAATPGPWRVHSRGDVALIDPRQWPAWAVADDPDGGEDDFERLVAEATAADADLIAHAPTDLAALLDEVERLRAQVDDYRTLAAGMVRLLDTATATDTATDTDTEDDHA
jgi:hypothetical protein